MKSNATAREEEVWRFPCRYIDSVNFAYCTNLPLLEFRSYLAEAASCEGVIIECDVRNALKQVNEVYFRLPHMFVSILTDMFSHWFA